MEPYDGWQRRLAALMEAYPRILRPPMDNASWPAGWDAILHELCGQLDAALTDEQAAAFEVVQIKEKFAGLRFYYRFAGTGPLHIDLVTPGEGRTHMTHLPGIADQDGDENASSWPYQSVDVLVQQAAEKSAKTCEMCGAPGSVGGRGWIHVYCEPCRRDGERR